MAATSAERKIRLIGVPGRHGILGKGDTPLVIDRCARLSLRTIREYALHEREAPTVSQAQACCRRTAGNGRIPKRPSSPRDRPAAA
jgi:hypothetical protein